MLGESGFHLGSGNFRWYMSPIRREGVSMFENSLRDNLKNMMIGLGLTVAVVCTGLAVAFW